MNYLDNIKRYNDIYLTNQNNGVYFIGDSFFNKEFYLSFKEDYEGYNVYLFGLCGAHINDWIKLYHVLFNDVVPEKIIIHLGTNDIYDEEVNDAELLNRFERLFDSIDERTSIYFIAITYRRYDEERIKQAKRINKEINRRYQLKKNFNYIDINEALANYPSIDGTHLVTEAYQEFKRALLEVGAIKKRP